MNCNHCTKNLTYDFSNVIGQTVTDDIFQVDGETYCRECIIRIIDQTHHKKTSGRKHIKITYELDRPTHWRGKTIK